jgi:hypothetical protein
MPHLPVARELKREILRTVSGLVDGGTDQLDDLNRRIDQPHITLELLCSMLRYRCGARYDPLRMWDSICAGAPVSKLTGLVALLRSRSLLGPLITTNFDATCMTALMHLGANLRVVTERQVGEGEWLPEEHDVCVLHGTTYQASGASFSPPMTATARGLARAFTPGMRRYLLNLFRADRPVLVIGYSGQDHYDLNPLLRELSERDPDALQRWLWICHVEADIARVPSIIRDDQVIVGDATALLQGLGYDDTLGSADLETSLSKETWRERLCRAIRQWNLPELGVRNFLDDIRINLPGAWAVLEHYRLYSAGYDEPVTLTFGGVDTQTPEEGGLDHLSYWYGPFELQFGKLLRASVEYRVEDTAYQNAVPANGCVPDYPYSTVLLRSARDSMRRAHQEVPRHRVRREDEALLLVGLAIAEDYLGLIERKRWLLLEGDASLTSRENALRHFRECQRYAEAAGRALTRTAGDGHQFDVSDIDDLIQYKVWALIGQSNIARTRERPAAIDVYAEVVERQKAAIAEELAVASGGSSRNAVVEGYVIAQYPQLWLRGSEWLKSILACEGDVAVPLAWHEIEESYRLLAAAAFQTCVAAYESYRQLTSTVNKRYPAVFETEILFFASQALDCSVLTSSRRQEAKSATRAAFARFEEYSSRHPTVSPVWVSNVKKRFLRIETAW